MIITNIHDLRELARRRLPHSLFDFIDGGAGDEVTLRANESDFHRFALLPRVLTDVSKRDQSVTVLGQKLDLPLILAPTGLPGILWPRGALEAALAADQAGAAFCLSTMSTSSIEVVSESVKRPIWFQLYVLRDRGLAKAMMERARDAGCSVLALTVDLAMQGQRDRDIRNGLTIPPQLRFSNLVDFAMHPGWLMRFLTGPKPTLANFIGAARHKNDMFTIAGFVNSQFDQSVTWKDIDWARDTWGGPLVLKGVLNPEDAALAVQHGVDGVIVSNHGGRQLDGVQSAIAALPGVVDAAQGKMDIILDGGVRRGTDVVKAIALGAKACMIGRPFLYGLAGMGGAGVARALEIFRGEIDLALALTGRASLADLDRSAIAWA
ncbi:MAG: alpha-hydroxy acid oxidase [Betaproteobacteria bacterium]